MTVSLESIMESSGFLADFFLLFDKWNTKKKERSISKQIIGIKERDIVFIQMGKNIGYEQVNLTKRI